MSDNSNILDKAILAQRLKKYRKEAGLSQEEVAEKLGISRTKYLNVENNNTGIYISFEDIQRFAQLVGQPLVVFTNSAVSEDNAAIENINKQTDIKEVKRAAIRLIIDNTEKTQEIQRLKQRLTDVLLDMNNNQ